MNLELRLLDITRVAATVLRKWEGKVDLFTKSNASIKCSPEYRIRGRVAEQSEASRNGGLISNVRERTPVVILGSTPRGRGILPHGTTAP